MSYRSLLFCPDEKATRAVTQILSELDFTVELAAEPFAAVKTLADEHFDALVVDCSNEQDASLLFKAAKSSSHNHSSLSVAVVEGQAGVAKAFRIGANLVLTKPINIEQSKGTLRVARGLLRKGQVKPTANSPATPVLNATPALSPAPSSATAPAADLPLEAKPSAPLMSIAPVVAPTLVPIMQSAPKPVSPSTPASPFSAFEVEEEAAPAPEASDAAVLESLHDSTSKSEPPAIVPLRQAEPIAAITSSQAAAAAPALEKKPVELKTAGAAPMFTNEPIHAEVKDPEPIEIEAPTFSSLDAAARKSGGGNGFLKIAAILLIAGVSGYFAWQKFQPLQYLHRNSAAASNEDATAPAQAVAQQEAPAPTSQPPQDAVNTATTPATQNAQEALPTISAGDVDSNAGKHTTSGHSSGSETIELQELPLSPDGKPAFTKTTITAKPQSQPLVVKSDANKLTTKSKPSQVSAPSVQIASSNNSDAQLADLISTPVALPKAVPGTLRISQGVSQGLLLKKVAPAYPPEALRMHKEGVVQLLATIGKTGNISNVKVLGGDPTLAQAAADAVLRWKYRPYLLNGQPVEIETQISVVFKAPR